MTDAKEQLVLARPRSSARDRSLACRGKSPRRPSIAQLGKLSRRDSRRAKWDPRRTAAWTAKGVTVLLVTLLAHGCKPDDMSDQPRVDPMEPSRFFADGTTARPVVPGTVARTSAVRAAGQRYAPQPPGQEAQSFPFPITAADLRRGKERYDIYCAVCHGVTGDGNGMIVQRGFVRPPAFYPLAEHAQRFPDLYAREHVLLNTPPGHVFNVITNGYGAMYSYASRVAADDRWRIAAYVRALQVSRHARPQDLSPEDRTGVERAAQQPPPAVPNAARSAGHGSAPRDDASSTTAHPPATTTQQQQPQPQTQQAQPQRNSQ